MSHCDPESLALMSLGEAAGTPEERLHARSCEVCQSDVANLRAVVVTARSGSRVQLLDPPPEVWDRIRAELDLSVDDSAGIRTSVADDVPGSSSASASADEPAADVVSLAERRTRRTRPASWLLAAAGVGGILVGGVITASVVSSSGGALSSKI